MNLLIFLQFEIDENSFVEKLIISFLMNKKIRNNCVIFELNNIFQLKNKKKKKKKKKEEKEE